ncbi:hypothetical protein HDV00_001441 [Rhizophlyctis rosea]|nr:hypothetical protein HDV00_001441 [Rhizophlyctis rosea]
MDANYLKQTVGTPLTQALTHLTLHTPLLSQPSQSQDLVTYIGRYLLSHDASKSLISSDTLHRQTLQSLKDDLARIQRAEADNRLRFECELRRRTSQIAESEVKREAEGVGKGGAGEGGAGTGSGQTDAGEDGAARPGVIAEGEEGGAEGAAEGAGGTTATEGESGEVGGGGGGGPEDIAESTIEEEKEEDY